MGFKVVAAGALGIVILAFLVLMAIGLANRAPATGLSGFTRIDKPVPTFAAQDFDGESFDLADHIGKPMVINFWASWCAPCREEAPILESAWRRYGPEGVLFVGVNMQDALAVGQEYMDEFDITYPNVRDPDGRVTVDYGVIGIPVTFFVDREGIVARRFVGSLPEDVFLAWVDELVAGESPTGEVDGQNLEDFRTLN
jgi:thiol-disulfide isomerase/thioredoxin